jgi:hypothetical protein
MPIILFLLFIGFSVAADSMAPEVMVGEELGVSSQKVSSYRGSSPGGSSTETHSDGEERGGTGDSPPSVSRRFSTDLAPKATPLAASSGWESGEVPVEERAMAFLAEMEALAGTITLADVSAHCRSEAELAFKKAFEENDLESHSVINFHLGRYIGIKKPKDMHKRLFSVELRQFRIAQPKEDEVALPYYRLFYNILQHDDLLWNEYQKAGKDIDDVLKWIKGDLVREGLERFGIDLSIPEPEPDLDYTGAANPLWDFLKDD